MSSTYTTTAGQNLLAMWSGKTGKMMLAAPIVLEDFTFFNNQAIVDLDGDGYPEVITGTGGLLPARLRRVRPRARRLAEVHGSMDHLDGRAR